MAPHILGLLFSSVLKIFGLPIMKKADLDSVSPGVNWR